MHIRPATEQDQETITHIVRAAKINPMDLDWRRFVVAAEEDRVIGVGQIKPHNDGSRELASIAVVPERRRQGIGGALIHALMQNEKPPLYLMCRDAMEPYYERFGFRKIGATEMPPYYKRMWRLVNALPEFVRAKVRVIVMKWG
jgi:N-acetylglutamate synthase-like GNAT family acetyltransferase